LEADPVFTRFVERRERLLDRLDTSRRQFDGWIEAHKTLPANVTDLAQLEGLLAERRNTLDELLKLDDSLLDHLVILLARGTPEGGPAQA
jgi:hypothetical protein